ncbi:MAG: addiction module protein [Planctomycetes bacterium]|nr:addiction module protein [Planctomycetota bacterium]
MSPEFQSLGIDRMSIEQRLLLVNEIWDSITAETGLVPMTDAQLAELERRVDEHEADPSTGVPWEQVREKLAKRLGQ